MLIKDIYVCCYISRYIILKPSWAMMAGCSYSRLRLLRSFSILSHDPGWYNELGDDGELSMEHE
jgi:hypothetical protein